MTAKPIRAVKGWVDSPKIPLASEFIVHLCAQSPSSTRIGCIDLSRPEKLLEQISRLLQLRAKHFPDEPYIATARAVLRALNLGK